MNEDNDTEQDLSDFHKDFLVRYMEIELKRQQLASDMFLKNRALKQPIC